MLPSRCVAVEFARAAALRSISRPMWSRMQPRPYSKFRSSDAPERRPQDSASARSGMCPGDHDTVAVGAGRSVPVLVPVVEPLQHNRFANVEGNRGVGVERTDVPGRDRATPSAAPWRPARQRRLRPHRPELSSLRVGSPLHAPPGAAADRRAWLHVRLITLGSHRQTTTLLRPRADTAPGELQRCRATVATPNWKQNPARHERSRHRRTQLELADRQAEGVLGRAKGDGNTQFHRATDRSGRGGCCRSCTTAQRDCGQREREYGESTDNS